MFSMKSIKKRILGFSNSEEGFKDITAVEVKTKKGKPSEKQTNYIKMVKAHGGYAGVARCNEDVDNIIQRY